MDEIMNWIRGVVYNLGFNPKLGSIFHSPTRSFQIEMKIWGDGIAKGIENGMFDAETWAPVNAALFPPVLVPHKHRYKFIEAYGQNNRLRFMCQTCFEGRTCDRNYLWMSHERD